MTDVVQKLWGFCHTLRHDGIDYGDYIEQLTYLLFLKMADERGRLKYQKTATGPLFTNNPEQISPIITLMFSALSLNKKVCSETSSLERSRASTIPLTSNA